MIKKSLLKFILFSLAIFSSSKIFAVDDSNSFYVPDTVSPEAAEFISIFRKSWRNRDWPAPTDHASWAERKAEYEKSTRENNEKLVEKFEATVTEITIGDVKALDIKPKNWDKSRNIVIYFHGGAYTLFSAHTSLNNILPLADVTNLRFISVDYTTAPQARWQQTINDATTVINGLYENECPPRDSGLMQFIKGIFNECMPRKIAIMGDSAGGGLATAAILKLKDDDQPMPNALLLWSPWTDVTETGDTYHTLKDHELHYTYEKLLQHSANAYADPEDQKKPYVSPVYGTFTSNFPPTLIQGGTKEIFISNFVRLYQKIDNANGHNAKLDLYEGMWHVFQGNHEIPESKVAIRKSADFLLHYLK